MNEDERDLIELPSEIPIMKIRLQKFEKRLMDLEMVHRKVDVLKQKETQMSLVKELNNYKQRMQAND